ncbi:hypothetical protein HJFPF1_01000 [Paramyrothecium foliicola]|nr:hypothetical protein HJFPF1_01000 [Paramyrothecium foliicola]
MSATTVTVRPVHQFPFDARPGSESQPVQNESLQKEARYGAVSSPRSSMPPAGFSGYPMYPGLQTTTKSRPTYRESTPVVLNTPKRLSQASYPSISLSEMKVTPRGIITSIESVDGQGRTASYSNPMQAPSLHYRPRRRISRQPNEMFAALPGEVLEIILEKVKQLHLGAGSTSCATCWMRDLCNICLASRKCAEFSRAALYGDIQLVGSDSAAHRKKFKLTQGARMLMLRRTLRSTPELAGLVRRIKVPRLELLENGTTPKGSLSPEQYEDLTASLVMACPNLEKLTGPTPKYCHSFSKIFHALSTRAKLREMDWLLEPSAVEVQRPRQSAMPGSAGAVFPAGLDPQHGEMFLDLHANWTNLRSLTIHCLPGGTLAPNKLLSGMLAQLPSLQHLHLCNLPPNAFNDHNLLSLPRLLSLSLSHISGITSNGFSTFATRANSHSLQKLHLRHTPLASLPALARLLSNLTQLKAFSLVQAYPPVMPESDTFALWMMPYLASSSITKLHWDITCLTDRINPSDDILSRSIAAGGFPQLKRLRAPNDPKAVFQALCRPVERVDFASDRFRRPNGAHSVMSTSTSTRSDQRKSHMPGQARPSSQSRPPRCTDLCSARLAAQARLEAAREQPLFSVNVTTEEGDTAAAFSIGGYMGTIGSQVEYYLHPDPGSSDEKGGLVDIRDLGEDNGESLSGSREGCTGRWNVSDGVVADKKEKEAWWHTERGRWKGVELH